MNRLHSSDRPAHTGEAENKSPRQSHRKLVQQVFDSAAPRYDLMNDLMTLGMHRPLKRYMVDMATIRPHHRVLDLAAGTCDLAPLVQRKLTEGVLVAVDPNTHMLRRGRDRLLDKGIAGVPAVRALAEHLPFGDDTFDRVLIAFGLRNFSNMEAALAQAARCLRPGGRLVVLEMSLPPSRRLRSVYDGVSSQLLPRLGAWVTGNAAPYQYLHDSIRQHPSPHRIADLMRDNGFATADFQRLAGGLFCLHLGEAA